MLGRSVSLATVLLTLSGSFANAHGSHSSEQNPSSDWATQHMQGASLSSIAPEESRNPSNIRKLQRSTTLIPLILHPSLLSTIMITQGHGQPMRYGRHMASMMSQMQVLVKSASNRLSGKSLGFSTLGTLDSSLEITGCV